MKAGVVSLLAAGLLAHGANAWARENFAARIPNGAANNCLTCHANANGQGARNAFGNAVALNKVGGLPNWPALWPLDSDADGYTNGEELGDPCGVWVYPVTPQYTAGITNPGVVGSVPGQHTAGNCPVGGSSSSSSSSSSSVAVSSSSSSLSSSSSSSSSSIASSSSSGGGATCLGYCNTIMANCSGANQQYQHLGTCVPACNPAVMPAGTPGEQSGNSLECRAYHATAAGADPATHCDHAGPSGGGVCGTACDHYCDVVLAACTGENAVFTSRLECQVWCGSYPTTGRPIDNAGNSVHCRTYWATGALGDPAAYCPNAAANSPACVDTLPASSTGGGASSSAASAAAVASVTGSGGSSGGIVVEEGDGGVTPGRVRARPRQTDDGGCAQSGPELPVFTLLGALVLVARRRR